MVEQVENVFFVTFSAHLSPVDLSSLPLDRTVEGVAYCSSAEKGVTASLWDDDLVSLTRRVNLLVRKRA